MSQKDEWFSRKFDPETLEQGINAYAAQGWTVISIATASIPGFGGSREELLVGHCQTNAAGASVAA